MIRFWTDEQVDAASQMWRDGVRVDDIAAAIGKTRQAVAKKARANRDRFPARLSGFEQTRVVVNPAGERKRGG